MTSENAAPTAPNRIAQGMIRAELKTPTIEKVKDKPLKKIVQDIIIHNDSEIDIPNASFFFKFTSPTWPANEQEISITIEGPHVGATLYDVLYDADGKSFPLELSGGLDANEVYIISGTSVFAPLNARSAVRLNLFYYEMDGNHQGGEHKVPLIEQMFVGCPLYDSESLKNGWVASNPHYKYEKEFTKLDLSKGYVQSIKVQNIQNALFHEPHVLWMVNTEEFAHQIKKYSGNIAEKFDVVPFKYNGAIPLLYLMSSRILDDNSKGSEFVADYSILFPRFENSGESIRPDFIGIPARLTRT
ncbi:hypothetical protein [Serratia liquefaciens]|uniref:hypothetical protein n=1 Tax=Serratia liquefaciens TaxID=614 RepID=UPI003905920C